MTQNATWGCAGSLHACALRIAKLDTDGVPLPGAGNVYVTSALVEIGFEVVVSEGEDLEQQNGCGDVCVSYKNPDKFKRFDLTMQICRPDPEIIAMLVTGVSTISTGGNVIGWSSPEVGTISGNGASIEVWSTAIIDGAMAGTRPYFRWVMPKTKWQLGGQTLNNQIMVPTLNGFTETNQNWYNGPANDWPYDSDRHLHVARDTAIPTTTCGATTLSAS